MGFNSGFKGLIVSIRHLVCVTLCRWQFGVQVWLRQTVRQVGYLQRSIVQF